MHAAVRIGEAKHSLVILGFLYWTDPVSVWAVQVFGLPVANLREVEVDYLFELILAMLGMDSPRTIEKIKQVNG